MTPGNFRGLKFSRIVGLGYFAENILGTNLGHFSRIPTKTRNPRTFSTAKISWYTVLSAIQSFSKLEITVYAHYLRNSNGSPPP